MFLCSVVICVDLLYIRSNNSWEMWGWLKDLNAFKERHEDFEKASKDEDIEKASKDDNFEKVAKAL